MFLDLGSNANMAITSGMPHSSIRLQSFSSHDHRRYGLLRHQSPAPLSSALRRRRRVHRGRRIPSRPDAVQRVLQHRDGPGRHGGLRDAASVRPAEHTVRGDVPGRHRHLPDHLQHAVVGGEQHRGGAEARRRARHGRRLGQPERRRVVQHLHHAREAAVLVRPRRRARLPDPLLAGRLHLHALRAARREPQEAGRSEG